MPNIEQEIKDMIEHYRPKGPNFDHEEGGVKLMRAFLACNALALTQHEIINGRTPIRPLDSQPGPFLPRQ